MSVSDGRTTLTLAHAEPGKLSLGVDAGHARWRMEVPAQGVSSSCETTFLSSVAR